MLRELLEEEQYRVVAVANGAEALETLRGETVPNVILLDVSMPVWTGSTSCATATTTRARRRAGRPRHQRESRTSGPRSA